MFSSRTTNQMNEQADKMAGLLDRIRHTHTGSEEMSPNEALMLATAAHLLRQATPLRLAKAVIAARKELGITG